MPEREQEILETILKAIPKMSDFDKGYLFGKAESMEDENREKEEKDEQR